MAIPRSSGSRSRATLREVSPDRRQDRPLSGALPRARRAAEARRQPRPRPRDPRLAMILTDGGDCLADLGAVRDQAVLCHADV
jgi:hypothetical protein